MVWRAQGAGRHWQELAGKLPVAGARWAECRKGAECWGGWGSKRPRRRRLMGSSRKKCKVPRQLLAIWENGEAQNREAHAYLLRRLCLYLCYAGSTGWHCGGVLERKSVLGLGKVRRKKKGFRWEKAVFRSRSVVRRDHGYFSMKPWS